MLVKHVVIYRQNALSRYLSKRVICEKRKKTVRN